MIEPVPLPPEPPAGEEAPPPGSEAIVLEDLVAVIRLPGVFRKVERVLERMLASFRLPEDSPFRPWGEGPGDGRLEYGLRWRDTDGLLEVFAGMAWGDQGHDPLWEVRVAALPPVDADRIRRARLHRAAARRAESRFREWDVFWHEDRTEGSFLVGASAACTRFLEENDPDAVAAEYLAGALHALHASGALGALLEVARAHPAAPSEE